MDVDLDDAGIGRHLDDLEPRVVRRRIAFDMQGKAELPGGRFDLRDQLEIVLELRHRRHEHAEHAVARLDRQRRAHRAFDDRLLAKPGLRRRRCARSGLAGTAPARNPGARDAPRADPADGCAEPRRRQMRQRGHRQSQADGRVARHQEKAPAAQLPTLDRQPDSACAFQRWIGRTKPVGVPRPRSKTRRMRARSSGSASFGSGGSTLKGSCAPSPATGRGPRRPGAHARRERRGSPRDWPRSARPRQPSRRSSLWAARSGVRPARSARRRAPIEPEGPARQALARIPFALDRNAAGRRARSASRSRRISMSAYGASSARRRRVPFRPLEIVDRDEGRFAAHGEAHVLRDEVGVHRFAERSSAPKPHPERRRDARGLTMRSTASRSRTRHWPDRRARRSARGSIMRRRRRAANGLRRKTVRRSDRGRPSPRRENRPRSRHADR